MAYLSGYSKYKVLTLTGGASGALTDHQLKLAVSYEAAMQGDFDDLRFTQADGTTLVDAWAELIVTDTSATVWVEFPTTPANTVEQIYRMYYGNAGASDYWDIDATFLLGDDFPGSSIDTGKWTVTGTVTVSNSEASLDQDDALRSIATFGFGTAVTAKSKADEQDSSFVGYYTNGDNRTQLQNSDFTANNDFDNIMLLARKSASQSISQNQWSDFRNTYYQYEIERLSTSSLKYRQGSNSNTYTNSTYIATGDMPVDMYVWDSSQASTLTCDWIFVRKCVANPPTYAFGTEQSVPTGNPYWYYNLLKRRN